MVYFFNVKDIFFSFTPARRRRGGSTTCPDPSGEFHGVIFVFILIIKL